MPQLGPIELIVILVIVLVIFGAGRLAEIGGAFGKGIREFKTAVRDDEGPAETPQVSGDADAVPKGTTVVVPEGEAETAQKRASTAPAAAPGAETAPTTASAATRSSAAPATGATEPVSRPAEPAADSPRRES